MSSTVRVFGTMAINEGMLEEFKTHIGGMIDAVAANEPGTRIYEAYISEDGRACYFVEEYQDSAAVEAHMANIGDLIPPMLETAQITSGHILGDISGELKEMLTPFGAAFGAHWKGIA